MDWNKEIYGLARQIAGVNVKDLKQRLGNPDDLPSVDETKAKIEAEFTHLHDRFKTELQARHKQERAPLVKQRTSLVAEQRQARKTLQNHQAQRWEQEAQSRQAKIRQGLGGLWDLITGRSKKLRKQNERETQQCEQRDKAEQQAMQLAQISERRKLQQDLKQLRAQQKHELSKLTQSFENSHPKPPEVKL